jgi:hypothetical protein
MTLCFLLHGHEALSVGELRLGWKFANETSQMNISNAKIKSTLYRTLKEHRFPYKIMTNGTFW